MIDIAEQTLEHYFTKFLAPKPNELIIKDLSLQEKAWNVFITLYKNGEVRGSAGNIKEIEENLVAEITGNTIEAATSDSRFDKVKAEEKNDIKIRLDYIKDRKIIDEITLRRIDPVKNGVIAIKRDYEKLAVILPNMSPSLITGSDFLEVLARKLGGEKVTDKDFILYQIQTEVETNY